MFTNWTTFALEKHLTSFDNLEFILRIVIACVLGMIIGLERVRRYKDAGIRTHCIIAMASAVFMILSKYAFLDTQDVLGLRGADPSRIAAQVVSGISFLGAGIIFKHGRSTVHGLTTAAGMWATAAVGLCIGAGLYCVGISETVILLGMQILMHKYHPAGEITFEQVINIQMKENAELLEKIELLLKEHRATVFESSQTRNEDKVCCTLTFRTEAAIDNMEIMKFALRYPEITYIDCH